MRKNVVLQAMSSTKFGRSKENRQRRVSTKILVVCWCYKDFFPRISEHPVHIFFGGTGFGRLQVHFNIMANRENGIANLATIDSILEMQLIHKNHEGD